MDAAQQKIVPNLWFDSEAEEAAHHYVDAVGDGRVLGTLTYGPEHPDLEGTVMTVDFELHGQRFTAINGGPQFPFTEAVSLEIVCDDQAEVDAVWAGLVDGGRPGPCGWLKDRFGLSWQVTPRVLGELLHGDDPDGVRRATQAMLATGGGPFDVAALQAAYDGVDATGRG